MFAVTSEWLVSNDAVSRVPVLCVALVLNQMLYWNCYQLLAQRYSEKAPSSTYHCSTLCSVHHQHLSEFQLCCYTILCTLVDELMLWTTCRRRGFCLQSHKWVGQGTMNMIWMTLYKYLLVKKVIVREGLYPRPIVLLVETKPWVWICFCQDGRSSSIILIYYTSTNHDLLDTYFWVPVYK